MSRALLFAANWKMHHAPEAAVQFARRFQELVAPRADRALWFFPPAVSLEATAQAFARRADVHVGAQHVHWEAKGAFTGEISLPMVRAVGGAGALVGHSERRHLFGETDEQAARKVAAVLAARLQPILCVGETLAERDAGRTEDVVGRQLTAALRGLAPEDAARLVIAYEPVWAIGTGRVARPEDAAAVHRHIRTLAAAFGVPGRLPVLYGGSVNAGNALGLLAEPEIDGLLVGGASLDPDTWAEIVGLGA